MDKKTESQIRELRYSINSMMNDLSNMQTLINNIIDEIDREKPLPPRIDPKDYPNLNMTIGGCRICQKSIVGNMQCYKDDCPSKVSGISISGESNISQHLDKN